MDSNDHLFTIDEPSRLQTAHIAEVVLQVRLRRAKNDDVC